MNFENSIPGMAFYPNKATFAPAELASFTLVIVSRSRQQVRFSASVYNGVVKVAQFSETRPISRGENRLLFSWQPPAKSPAGYGIEMIIHAEDWSEKVETAFDVLADWTSFPRYGFLCDFAPDRLDEARTMEVLAKFHINGLQFYDWQYRHDDLVPHQTEYDDPLGRKLSLAKIQNLIAQAHLRGMAAMPYLTIYAASAAFWKAHPEWMLYDEAHQPIPFGDDFLGIMDPQKGGGWFSHLLLQCAHVLAELPFDGLHIDQFGEPKTGFDHDRKPVDLPLEFGNFIAEVSNQHPNAPIVFNAVGNWPIETLARSSTAFNYIEIWPPDILYTDVVRIVRNARQLSGGKPVVIALYIPAERMLNNMLADALILCAGGTRIVIGEDARLLSDPYFPKHEEMPPALLAAMSKHQDLMVWYEEWFGPLVDEADGGEISAPAELTCFYRRSGDKGSIGLVHLPANAGWKWNEAMAWPTPVANIELTVTSATAPKQVMLVNPMGDSLLPQQVDFTYSDQKLLIRIPGIDLWGLVLLQY